MAVNTFREWRKKGAKEEEECRRYVKALAAFSVLSNGKELFNPNIYNGGKNINCLAGIRVLAVLVVMLLHGSLPASVLPCTNSFLQVIKSITNSILNPIYLFLRPTLKIYDLSSVFCHVVKYVY